MHAGDADSGSVDAPRMARWHREKMGTIEFQPPGPMMRFEKEGTASSIGLSKSFGTKPSLGSAYGKAASPEPLFES